MSQTATNIESSALVIFTIPKPFHGHVGIIQTNAIRSWRKLGKQVEIHLYGDEPGTAEMAQEVGAVHVPNIGRNAHGTPLLDCVFKDTHKRSDAPYLAYVNADILLLQNFWQTLECVRASSCDRFVISGRRTNLDLRSPIEMTRADWEAKLKSLADSHGKRASRVCKDYFIFTRPEFENIPPFAVGRGNWDNWVLKSAKLRNIPVIDGTGWIDAIHQNHDYSHFNDTRLAAYVTGPEAKENKRLAGGSHGFFGSFPTWGIRGGRAAPLSFRSQLWLIISELPYFVRHTFTFDIKPMEQADSTKPPP